MIIIIKLILLIYFLFKFNGIFKSRKELFEQKLKIKLNNLENDDKYIIKDFEFIVNYNGSNLEPEWDWVKNISFVYTWVDGSDINLANIKSKYNGGNKEVNSRDRSADELQYSLRSLKKYVPWHNGTIFIVTDNQIPKWLDMNNNNQIKIISHEEIIPKYIYPTFDSSTIECFLDNIPGISDIFIYLNDDFFFNNFVHPSFFFTSEKFEPKIYRTNTEIFDEEKIENFIKENDIHHIYDASAYFTFKIILEYFDHNYTYSHLAHSPYVCYRSFFKLFRQYFEEELKVVFSHRFRSPYKPITLYLYQTLLLYLNKNLTFPSSTVHKKKLFDFKKKYLNNNIVSNYSFKLIPEGISNLFIKFSFVKDESKSNYDNFKFLINNKNILIYNLNDKYNNEKSLFELTKYMIIRYPENNTFEKTNYVNLEKEYLYKLEYPEEIIKNNVGYQNENKINRNLNKIMFNWKNLKYIEEYLEHRNKFSNNHNISLMEKDEFEILFDYDRRELEPEWEWIKNISFVYIITESKYKIINELKYSLRSIETFLPWFFGTIFIIVQRMTYNLSWINKNNCHIKIIDPKDIVSNYYYGNYTREIIEMYLDKIPLISERFILLNQDHYFKHFIHPIFFFNKDFFPKYNYDYEFDQKIKTNSNVSFFKTYELIQEIFGKNYVNNNRKLVDSPIPLYRDLFKPVRELYLSKMLKNNNQSFTILPLYLLSTYNIYETAQIYYPNYVAGFGKIRDIPPPILNQKRTISYYGFDITSEYILKNSILIVDLFPDLKKKLEELEKSNVLLLCIKLNDNLDKYELNLVNNFLQKLFNNKSIFEI